MMTFRAALWRWRRLIAATFVTLAVAFALATTSTSVESMRVPVAERDLPAGHVLTEGDLKLARSPGSDLPVASIEDLVDGTLAVSLPAGTPVTESMLMGEGLAGGAPADHTVVAVPVSTPPELTPVGSTVDLYAPPGEGEAEAVLVASSAVVVSIDDIESSAISTNMLDITKLYLVIKDSDAKLILGISAQTPLLAVVDR